MAHDVFISHSARDKPYADAMCAKLESRGIRCWIAPRDIRPGMEWGAAILAHNGTVPVGSYQANAFGLYDMAGNVDEWTEDCFHDSYNDSYARAPVDGTPWTTGDCARRVLRGGSWGDTTGSLRSADRNSVLTSYRSGDLGFRVARTL